jgi:hypothetical protein
MLFIDLVDIPFILATVLVTVTVWRGFHFWKHIWPQKIKIHDTTATTGAGGAPATPQVTYSIYDHPKRSAWRWQISVQFLYWCADIPTAFLALLVFCSIYRAKKLAVPLKKV